MLPNFEQNMILAKDILTKAPEMAKLVDRWQKQPEPPGCESFFGGVQHGDERWNFVLVKFPATSTLLHVLGGEGGYGGEDGWDGTVTLGTVIVRAHHAVSKDLYEIAEQWWAEHSP